MELATFSDIEFVGIAAERDVVVNSARGGRGNQGSPSTTISLESVDSEVQGHDQSLRASAFDIRETYTVTAPLSPSAFAVELVPDTSDAFVVELPRTPGVEHNLSIVSTWSGTPSISMPLERYRRDSQRHERLAVSVALDRSCKLGRTDDSMSDGPVFRRSAAPSPSSGKRLGAHGNGEEVPGDATTTRSVVNPDDDDSQALLRSYSLERWFGSTIKTTEELAVEVQKSLPGSTTHQAPTPPATRRRIIDPIELDPASEANGDLHSMARQIQDCEAAVKMDNKRNTSTHHRKFREKRRRGSSEYVKNSKRRSGV